MNKNENIIYSLCVQNRWFTAGSNRQYDKMFELARAGYPVNHLARIIWLCSNEDIFSYDEIFSTISATEYESLDVW